MAKAVLVMDMPECCADCQLADDDSSEVCGKYPQPDGITPSYKVGWNSCLDEILEERKE